MLAVILTAGSCSKNNPDSLREVRMNVTFPQFESTKSVFSDGSLFWEDGDEIGVWDGQSVRKAVLDDSSGSTTACFDVQVSTAAERLVVVYPYDSLDVFEGTCVIVDQTEVELGNSLKRQIKAVGICSVSEPEVTLTNIKSILRFEVVSDDVRGLSFHGNRGESVCFRARVDAENVSAGITRESIDYPELYLNGISGKGVYYLGLICGIKLEQGYTMDFYKDEDLSHPNLLGSYRNAGPLIINAGSWKDLGALEYDAPMIENVANCYYIEKPGTYSLKLVKGNSDESVGDVHSAAVLWETFNTSEVPAEGSVVSSVELKDNNIQYTTTSTPGNAVIAAKDASGNILWSWHIWNCLERQATEMLTNGTEVLDRNVGALSVSGKLSAGLMYQWGRKDPFLGSCNYQAGNKAFAVATAPLNGRAYKVTSASVGTVEYAVSHPMEWIASSTESSNDWYYLTLNDALWGRAKTIYDPCPAGYRVVDPISMLCVDHVDWPLAGRVNTKGTGWETEPGKACFYWYSVTRGSTSTGGYSISLDNRGIIDDGAGGRSLGAPVRCVKD